MEISNPYLNVAFEEFKIRFKEVDDYVSFVNKLDHSYIGERIVIDKDDILIDINFLEMNISLLDVNFSELKYCLVDKEETVDFSSVDDNIMNLNSDVKQLEVKIKNETSEVTKIDRDLLKTLRASSYLLLYNLLESTMSEAIDAIHQTIDNEGVEITQLSENVHQVILSSFQKGFTNEKVSHYSKENIDIRSDLMNLGYDKKRLFSGNIDGELIEKYCKRYGFKPFPIKDSSGKAYNYDKAILKEVKQKRNSLAHGSESFINCGQSIVIGSLTEKIQHTEAILLAVFNGLNSFLEKEKYLKNS